MMQMIQEMMGVQQEQLMCLQGKLHSWENRLVEQEQTVNDCLIWLRSRLEGIDVDEEELSDNREVDEEMTMVEVDKGSPVVLDLDLDDFRPPEPKLVLTRQGDMGGWFNWLVQIEEKLLDEVEELVLSGVPPLYDD